MIWRKADRIVNRRKALVGFGLAALTPLGCLTKNFTGTKPDDASMASFTRAPSPRETLAQNSLTARPGNGRLASTWDKRVSYAPDPCRGGAEMTGLVCRFYLLGPDKATAFIGDGSLIVDLYDATPNGNAEPVLQDELRLTAVDLKRFTTSDSIWGNGYTIFMPWTHYSPQAKLVFINMLYTSANGETFFDHQGPFAIDHSETAERIKRGISIRSGMANIPVGQIVPVSANAPTR